MVQRTIHKIHKDQDQECQPPLGMNLRYLVGDEDEKMKMDDEG
jgi:hypothetical protein